MRWITDRIRPHTRPALAAGIPYAEVDGGQLLLDVYPPTGGEQPHPAVLVIHGGGFVGGSRTDGGVVAAARDLAAAGYVALAIDYRLVDPGRAGSVWPAPLDDAQSAVRWARVHAASYGIDPERIGAFGVSAGAGLAAHLGVRDNRDPAADAAAPSSRVRCVVAVSGPMDGSVPPANPGDLDVARALFGGTPAEVPNVYRDASPVAHVDAASVPFLVVHGVRDTVVPVAHSRRLVAALQEAGVAVDYVEIPDAGHDVFWDRIGARTLAFLGSYLDPER